ncbi:MAG TPA: CBS domain-containing protein [Gaiellaceae bacterium]|nr:CBS domain-containing protein [Gaiellaceae bacterium]
MLVADVMTHGLVTCPPGTPLGEAAALLVWRRVHAVVVAEDDGVPLGVLSDADLLAGEWLAADEQRLATLRAMTAGELMTAPVETIAIGAEVAEAARRLRAAHLSRLVVEDEGGAVGVVSVSDLVRSIVPGDVRRATVADVMTRGFVACRDDTPARAVARLMTERSSRSVLVLGHGGRATGVVTGHDLLPLVEDGVERTAGELMSPPLTVAPGASLADAADALVRNEVHRLVVVADGEGGTPLGILSTWDLLAEMAAPGSVWR